MRQKDIEFPDCWEEVKPLEWLHLLKNREKLMTKPGISLLDVKREWCAYVLKNRGYVFRSKVQDMLLGGPSGRDIGMDVENGGRRCGTGV